MNFTWAHLQRGGFERNYRIESFGYIPRLKKKGRFAHGIRNRLYKKRLARQIVLVLVVVLVLEKRFFPGHDWLAECDSCPDGASDIANTIENEDDDEDEYEKPLSTHAGGVADIPPQNITLWKGREEHKD